jgi:hypothetical protein
MDAAGIIFMARTESRGEERELVPRFFVLLTEFGDGGEKLPLPENFALEVMTP